MMTNSDLNFKRHNYYTFEIHDQSLKFINNRFFAGFGSYDRILESHVIE